MLNEPRDTNQTSAVDPRDGAPVVRMTAVGKGFREGGRTRSILDGVDLEIGRGELAVVLGRSGSGKSTLLNLIGGIDRADEGRVTIDGIELGGASEHELTLFRRRHIGFVFQFFNLVPTLTVKENVLLRLELDRRAGGEARRRALDLLGEVGLGDRADAWPDRLSGGEQQRVAIVAALAHDPALVLADEPTGNLDLETGRQVLAILDRLTRAAGKTLVMATHAKEVVGLADRVLTIREGRVVTAPGAPSR